MIFYRISELMLYTIKVILLWIQLKNERLSEILQDIRCHIIWSYLYHISIN